MNKFITKFRVLLTKFIPFRNSSDYWERRYRMGGTSGQGSYDEFAEFKARELNGLVADENIQSVIEFGCGDGNQLKLLKFNSYIGVDVSQTAIERCKDLFNADSSKKFLLSSEYGGEQAELSLSLDVIFHLVEEEVFEDYMRQLFAAGLKMVAIYSSNSTNVNLKDRSHVKHRQFSLWVDKNAPEFELIKEIPTVIKGREKDKTALKSLFVYRRK